MVERTFPFWQLLSFLSPIEGMEKVEKTIESTARVLASLSSKDTGHTKEFQNLIRQIGESKTKHEEDRIIRREAIHLKDKMGARDINPVSPPSSPAWILIFLHGRMILGSYCDFQVTCLPSYCPIREQQYDIICISM